MRAEAVVKSSEPLTSSDPPTKSICSASCFDVRVVVPSSRRLATRFAKPALSGGSCADPVLIKAWISTIGKKCCSSTSTVMPFGVTNLVGIISAARREDVGKARAHQLHATIRNSFCRRRRQNNAVSNAIRTFPAARRPGLLPVACEAWGSRCPPFACPRLSIAAPLVGRP